MLTERDTNVIKSPIRARPSGNLPQAGLNGHHNKQAIVGVRSKTASRRSSPTGQNQGRRRSSIRTSSGHLSSPGVARNQSIRASTGSRSAWSPSIDASHRDDLLGTDLGLDQIDEEEDLGSIHDARSAAAEKRAKNREAQQRHRQKKALAESTLRKIIDKKDCYIRRAVEYSAKPYGDREAEKYGYRCIVEELTKALAVTEVNYHEIEDEEERMHYRGGSVG